MTKDIAPIYEEIKNQIITLDLKPGTRICETEISTRFGVSRTPVRDVLKKLEEDKLLVVFPKSGTYISKIDLSGLSDIMYLRTSVETNVMSELMNKISPSQLKHLYDVLEEQEKALNREVIGSKSFANLFFTYDLDFHREIYRLVDKENLLELLNDSFPYYQRYRYMTNLRQKESVAALCSIHRELLEAMEKKDAKMLLEVSKRHNTSGLNGIKTVLEKHPDYFN